MNAPAQAWYSFDQGATLGGKGSENGTILLDEEHVDGARITLEENGYQPYAITCGIYGMLFVLTTFASTLTEAKEKYEHMKYDLSEYFRLCYASPLEDDDLLEYELRLISEFADKYQ